MRRIVLGILAHVDSGKTTLAEGLLFQTGSIRKPGRVDHKNAFLDMYNRYITGITDENAEVSAIKETTSKGITYDYVFITELYIEVNGKHTTLYYYLTRKSTRNMKKWK